MHERHDALSVLASPAVIAGLAALVLLGSVALWYLLAREPAPEPERVAAAPAPAPARSEPRVAEPPEPVEPAAPAPEPAVPLPELDASDDELESALVESFGPQLVEQYLRPENFVRNVVVTVDNLGRTSLPLDRRPLQPTPGVLAVEGPEDARTLSERNYSRYTPFVTLVSRTEARTLVALYRRYYPLMQEAYLELGNPDTDFNARVIEVIDHLLATPDVAGPISLEQPNVLFEYADPALEELSPGRKIVLRMGPAHAATIKGKLREIRALVAGEAKPEPEP